MNKFCKPAVCALAVVWAAAALAADVAPHSAVAAPEWTALFDAPFGAAPGWAGADGVYSLPLDGDERMGQGGGARRHLIWFSDTFVGGVAADRSRQSGTVMVNNTTALLTGSQPDPARLQFQVRLDAHGGALAMVAPKARERWYWPNDGVTVGGKTYTYALRMKAGGAGAFAFEVDGVDLLAARAADAVPFAGGYAQRQMPLYAPATATRGETTYGMATLALTRAARAPNPDGWVYVYGLRNDNLNKKLLVARVAPKQVANASAYRFWTGSDWSADIGAAASIAGRLSSEFSVQPLADGRFLLIHQWDALGANVVARYAASPTGPFGPPTIVWTCPEAGLTPNTYVYGAKAHPNLSQAGELLISYHVNTFDFWENFGPGGADIYRPRFIKLPLP